MLEIINNENLILVSEPSSTYISNKPITETEIEKNLKEKNLILPQTILKLLKNSEKQIENGEYYTNEEVEQYFEEWLEK